MKSRKWIGTVLITLVVIAVLAAGSYALYQFGYARGFQATHMAEGFMFHDFDDMPFHGGRFGALPEGRLGELPERFRDQMHYPDRYPFPQMMPYGGRYPTLNVFSPFTLLLKVIFLGFLIWVIYKIITLFTGGKSWQLSFNAADEVEQEEESKPRGRAKKS